MKLSQNDYEKLWDGLGDFIRFNPGARHRRRIIHKLLKDVHFNSLLEVGCGPGEILLMVYQNFPAVTSLVGADFAAKTLEENSVRMPWAHFVQLDIEITALTDQFDVVICSEVIEHLADQSTAIKNLSKMVKKDGYLLISCPTGKIYGTEKVFGHIHHPTKEELFKMATENNLVIQKKLQWGWPFYYLLKEATNISSTFSIEHFASGRYSAFKRWFCDILYYLNFANHPNCASGCQIFMLLKKP